MTPPDPILITCINVANICPDHHRNFTIGGSITRFDVHYFIGAFRALNLDAKQVYASGRCKLPKLIQAELVNIVRENHPQLVNFMIRVEGDKYDHTIVHASQNLLHLVGKRL